MRGVFGALTLAMVGVIVADLVMHPAALTAGGTALNNILKSTYSAMLGTAPK